MRDAILGVFDDWMTSDNTAANFAECLDQSPAVVVVTEHSDIVEKTKHLNRPRASIEVVADGRDFLDGNATEVRDILYRAIGR